MNRALLAIAFLALLFQCNGCRNGSEAPKTEAPETANDPSPKTPSAVDTLKAVAKNVMGPPSLKPIAKGPFPEGATEEQVCEAIADVDQKDLWVRFGHLVPLYEVGSVFILDATAEKADGVRKFILEDYSGGGHFYPQIMACRQQGRALLYLRNLYDDAVLGGELMGRQDLSAQLKTKLQAATIESYFFQHRSNTEPDRLAEYCRADAYLCAELMGLFDPQGGRTALCRSALVWLGIRGAERSKRIKECEKLSSPPLSCVIFANGTSATRHCEELIASALELGP